ncbi:MAG: Rieske (2Fe-2S) protein [Gemmatimonadota bacterium]|nr:Rieske (2Fe-2S) protein [Gemmatimonadota bacterium]MDE3171634.1 Rieske (2Fe-2S) protein [Gemmatimonadota bacterium]MDE3216893.1 Rieske (2Fe-2S) protein [Gemmatimonadota bacterium]
MHDDHAPRGAADGCDSCAVAAESRRRFLRDAAVMVAGTLAALTAAPVSAAALDTRFVRAVASTDETKSYAIPATDAVNIDRDESVIVARYQGKVYVFSLACPHQNTALQWDSDVQEFRCPKHHSTYTPDGIFIDGRATRSMDRFAVKHTGANVVADLDQLYREDEDPDLWKAAFITL